MVDIKQIILKRNESLNVEFVEESHKYYSNRQELKSVTTFKKKFFPFEAEEVAQRLANFSKGRKTKEQYLQEWKEAADFGTHIHKLVEDYIEGEEQTLEEYKQIEHAVKFINEEGFRNIATEIKVYSPSLGLAGTLDWLCEDEEGRLWIIDWKTTKTITETNPYEKANFPINHLDNSKSLGYAYQTTVYKYILDNEYNLPKKIHGIMIVQLNLNKTYKIYSSENGKLPILENEVVQTIFYDENEYFEGINEKLQNN